MTEPSVGAGAGRTTPADITAAAVASFAGCPDERLRWLVESLTTHLHAFATEVGLTLDEWEAAIRLLTETGRITDEHRQEFILWSDTLGLSMLVDALANPPRGATESTVLGPFYVPGRADARLRRRDLRGAGRPAGLGPRRRLGPRRHPDRRRRARRLAERRQPAVRGAGSARTRGAPPRPLLDQGGRKLRVPRRPPGAVHDPGRRAGRRDARRHGPPSVAAGAHPPDRAGRGLRARHDARLRPGERVPRLRRRVRREAVAAPRLRAAPGGRSGTSGGSRRAAGSRSATTSSSRRPTRRSRRSAARSHRQARIHTITRILAAAAGGRRPSGICSLRRRFRSCGIAGAGKSVNARAALLRARRRRSRRAPRPPAP